MKKSLFPLFILFLTACAPTASPVHRFFWPVGSSEPRIEYLAFLQSDQDLRRGKESRLADAILGREEPQLLFKRPHQVAADRKRILVTDPGHADVVVIDRQSHRVRFLGEINAGNLSFVSPYGIELTPDGSAYVSDSRGKKVHLFSPEGLLLASFGTGVLDRPTGLGYDPIRERLYVVDTGAHRIAVFGKGGEPLSTIGTRGSAEREFNFPLDVSVDAEGNLFVLDSLNARVQVLTPEGHFVRAFGERGTALGSFMLAKGLDVSPSGHVYITDSQANRFIIFDREGNLLLTVGGRYAVVGGQVAPGGLYLPQGIDVDENESIWVVDALNRMIHQFQYLNERYLAENPVLPGDAVVPAK